MPQSVKLSDELIKQARHYGDVYHRSTAKQIEYWSTIGKISEENPDLPYSFIKNILLAQREVRSGDVTPYEFGWNMKLLQSRQFAKAVKKLHTNQKADLDKAVQLLIQDPLIGDLKSGDLGGVRVYKFKMVNQLNRLAYSYEDKVFTLSLLALGSHENFSRDLKQSL